MKGSWVCGELLMVAFMCTACIGAKGQTDVGLSLYGTFAGATNSNGTISPANAAGGLIEVRHIKNPLVGFEATYSYNRANQTDSYSFSSPCPVGGTSPCGSAAVIAAVPANAHEVTGNWVVSLKAANLRPFALAGGGLLFNVPAASSVNATEIVCGTVNPLCSSGTTAIGTDTQTKGVFVYGAGLDWRLFPHIGLRLQYRGNVYKVPALLNTLSSVDAFTHTAQPMIGIYFRL